MLISVLNRGGVFAVADPKGGQGGGGGGGLVQLLKAQL